ncbi:MAG TPA: hypothetical protein VGI92_12245 [Gemmatimonadales bacterium]|jgi:hypothetical protein
MALLICACRHNDAYQIVEPPKSIQPLVVASPTRLTYNPLPDTEPSFLPGDSLLIYTAFRGDHDSDGCLQLLPSSGGQSARSICEPRLPGEDSVFAYQSGAVSTGGLLAYERSAKGPLNRFWTTHALMVRALDGTSPPRLITMLPAVGLIPEHSGATRIAWLDDHRFVYRADDYQNLFCFGCIPWDSSAGLFVNLVDVSTDPATITPVPGTTSATDVAVQDADAILVTLAGDTRVYRIVLSTGAVSVFWDFTPGIPISVAVAGNRLVASTDSFLMIDLPGGPPVTIDTVQWANLRLSADGKRLVALRRRNVQHCCVSPGSDLFLFDLQ